MPQTIFDDLHSQQTHPASTGKSGTIFDDIHNDAQALAQPTATTPEKPSLLDKVGDVAGAYLGSAAKAFGYDPEHPIASTVKAALQGSNPLFNIGPGPERQPVQTSLTRKPGQSRGEFFNEVVNNSGRGDVLGEVKSAGQSAGKIYTGLKTGDYNQAAEGAGELTPLGLAAAETARGALVRKPTNPYPDSARLATYPKQDHAMASTLPTTGDASKVYNTDLSHKAMPFVKKSHVENWHEAPMQAQSDLRNITDTARKTLWDTEIQPPINDAGPADLTPVAKHIISQIPDDVKLDPAENKRWIDVINRKYGNKQVDAQTLENLVQGARADIRTALARNNFERAAWEKTNEGRMANAQYEGLRQTLLDHVKNKTGHDLGPSLENYGNVSEFEQALGKVPPSTTLLQDLSGKYITGHESNLIGQATKIATKHFTSDLNVQRRALQNYPYDKNAGNPYVKRVEPDVEPEVAHAQIKPGIYQQGGQVGLKTAIPAAGETTFSRATLGRQNIPGGRPAVDIVSPSDVKYMPQQAPSSQPQMLPAHQVAGQLGAGPQPRGLISTGLAETPQGTTSPSAGVQPDPRLPAAYQQIQPFGTTSGGAYVGPIQQGQPGGVPQTGEQTPTPMTRSQRMNRGKAFSAVDTALRNRKK